MGRTATTLSLIALVGLCLAPLVVFVAQASSQGFVSAWEQSLTPAGVGSLTRTLKLMAVAGTVGTLSGWWIGAALSLRTGLLRRLALAVLAMPVMCPPFLWAVGVQGWKGLVPFTWQVWFDGFSGHVIASSIGITAVTALICAMRTEWLTRSAIESVRLARGPAWLFWMRLRMSWQPALGAGMLGALMVAGEAGTGQMMGYQGLPGVIHSAFVTEHDFTKAASRALVAAMALLPLGVVAAVLLATAMVQRRLAVNSLTQPPALPCGPGLASLAAAPLLAGLAGLVRPLLSGPSVPAFREALLTLQESIVPTATLFAAVTLLVALASIPLGRMMAGHPWLWRSVLCLGFVILAMPQSIHGLGWVMLRSWLPLPGGTGRALEVALVLASRWVLIAAHFVALAWQSLPSSAFDALRLSGSSWFARASVLGGPLIWQAALPAALCIALISLGDASSIAILQAPGWSTYTTRLFAIMDNAPEKQVAALCVVYLAVPGAMMTARHAFKLLKHLRP